MLEPLSHQAMAEESAMLDVCKKLTVITQVDTNVMLSKIVTIKKIL